LFGVHLGKSEWPSNNLSISNSDGYRHVRSKKLQNEMKKKVKKELSLSTAGGHKSSVRQQSNQNNSKNAIMKNSISQPDSNSAPSDEPRSYRITDIQAIETKETLLNVLESYFHHPRGKRFDKLITHFWLAPYNAEKQTAVVDFKQPPRSQRREEIPFSIQLSIDTEFHGITPILSPHADSPSHSFYSIGVE
jgi:hypothetical protein